MLGMEWLRGPPANARPCRESKLYKTATAFCHREAVQDISLGCTASFAVHPGIFFKGMTLTAVKSAQPAYRNPIS